MARTHQQKFRSWSQLFWVGTSLMTFYYVADCAMDALIFNEGTVLGQLLAPDSHELAIRILSGCFLFLFFLFARSLFIQNQSLQQRLLLKSQELIAANLQCEVFTHSFSMEMKSSITSINADEQLLAERHFEELSSECQDLLGKIRMTCTKMETRIDRVLDLSHALRSRLDCQSVSLSQLMQDVTRDVIAGVEDMTVSIETDKNLMLECDPDLMCLALKNLCMNAVNLSRASKQADISIGVELRNGIRTFFVRRDDLLGLPHEQSELFTLPLSKDMTEDQTGLLSVKTIIERHGGKIWTESAKGAGTAFCFTL